MFEWKKVKTEIAAIQQDLKKNPVIFPAALLLGVAIAIGGYRVLTWVTPPPGPGPTPSPGPIVTPEEKALLDGLRQGLGTLPAADSVLAAISAATWCKEPVSVVVVDAVSTWSDYGGKAAEPTPTGIDLNRAAGDDPQMAERVQFSYVSATHPTAPEIARAAEQAPDVIVLHRTAFALPGQDSSIQTLLEHVQRHLPKGGTVPPVIIFSRAPDTDSVWALSLRAKSGYGGHVVPYQFREGKPWADKEVPKEFVWFIERMGRADRCANPIRTMRQGS